MLAPRCELERRSARRDLAVIPHVIWAAEVARMQRVADVARLKRRMALALRHISRGERKARAGRKTRGLRERRREHRALRYRGLKTSCEEASARREARPSLDSVVPRRR